VADGLPAREMRLTVKARAANGARAIDAREQISLSMFGLYALGAPAPDHCKLNAVQATERHHGEASRVLKNLG